MAPTMAAAMPVDSIARPIGIVPARRKSVGASSACNASSGCRQRVSTMSTAPANASTAMGRSVKVAVSTTPSMIKIASLFFADRKIVCSTPSTRSRRPTSRSCCNPLAIPCNKRTSPFWRGNERRPRIRCRPCRCTPITITPYDWYSRSLPNGLPTKGDSGNTTASTTL